MARFTQPQAAPEPTSTVAEETPTTPATPPGRTLHSELKNSDGWTYEGDLPIPDVTVETFKDISGSPPSMAKLKASAEGTAIESQTFSVTNEGRPNGPEITVEPGSFVYGLPERFADSYTYEGVTSAGPCGLAGNDQIQNYEPFQIEWKCDAPTGTDADTGTSTDDGDEKDTDDLAEVVAGAEPTYVVNIGAPTRDCNIFIDPDSHIERAPTFKYGCSQKLTLSVSGS